MMRFSEGDKVRNLALEMGTGTITRHGAGPRSIRWVTRGGEVCWWVEFPRYRHAKWLPGLRGTAGWFYDRALEHDDWPALTEACRAAQERRDATAA